MDLEDVLTLFDSCWFNLEILKKHSNPIPSSNAQKNPDKKIQENSPESVYDDSPKLEIQVESQSDDLRYNSDSFSPDSVLPATHFQPYPKRAVSKKVKGKRRELRRRTKSRTTKGLSKSLSELEYEELKGFMDLGFEFSQEDVNSSLVDIIPGLNKLGKNMDNDGQEKMNIFEKSDKSRARPYLSEAWEVLEKKKRMNSLMQWKVPDKSNEIDIKHSLKWWAHTVASSVKQQNKG